MSGSPVVTVHQCTFDEMTLETYGQHAGLDDERTDNECDACGTELPADPYAQQCDYCGRELYR
jgi:Zn finger protein HypA/HybF involved in hydrogenase expression